MIEVEQKFLLKKGDFERLTEGAEPVVEKSFTDTYYDDANYKLSSQDIWLRDRDGAFELKVALGPIGSKGKADQYDEITSEREIIEKLQLVGENLPEALEKTGLKPFATFTSHRRKYRKGGFVLDFDTTDFDYSIGEIELLVEKQEDMASALDRIEKFAQDHQLTLATVRGKLIEYIRLNDPTHYHKLLELGVISDEQNRA